MFRFPVRRVTAAVAILAILCLAMPAAAAVSRPGAGKAPVVQGTLLDQFLGWVGSWFAPAPASKAPANQKILGITLPGGLDGASKSEPAPTERGGMIDPNG